MLRAFKGGRIPVRVGLLLMALVGAWVAAYGWEHEAVSVFQGRRARLVHELGGDGVVVLFGYRGADVAASVTSFRQNEEFYYLTGWNEPEAMMLLVPKAHAAEGIPELAEEILYI